MTTPMSQDELDALRALCDATPIDAMLSTCGYAVVAADGEQEPCGRRADSWAWYQDTEHEDLLSRACEWHSNIGGDLLARYHAAVPRLLDEVQRLRAQVAEAAEVGAALDEVAAEHADPDPEGVEVTRITITRTLTDDDDLHDMDVQPEDASLVEVLGLLDLSRDTVIHDRMEGGDE